MKAPIRPVCFAALIAIASACSVEEPIDPAGQPLSGASEVSASAAEEDARCRLATAESTGSDDCPGAGVDADHDMVDDSSDRCPDTTPGVAVDATGCARNE